MQTLCYDIELLEIQKDQHGQKLRSKGKGGAVMGQVEAMEEEV